MERVIIPRLFVGRRGGEPGVHCTVYLASLGLGVHVVKLHWKMPGTHKPYSMLPCTACSKYYSAGVPGWVENPDTEFRDGCQGKKKLEKKNTLLEGPDSSSANKQKYLH